MMKRLKSAGLEDEVESEVATLIEDALANPEDILREMHERYFMIDEVPENRKRFDVDFATLKFGKAPEPPLLGSQSQV